jgi:hypothetical protein
VRRQISTIGMVFGTLLLFGLPLRAQISSEELQKLKPQGTQLMLPLPSGAVLRGEGLDEWLGGGGPSGQQAMMRGFGNSNKSEDQKFFSLGELYTSLVIQAHSASTLDAAAAVASLREALVLLHAPEGFFSYLSEFELSVKSQTGGTEAAGRFAAALQGFLIDFVRSKGEAAYLRFQAGRWVTTLALAAHSRDTTGMQLSAASFFRGRFAEANAESGVVEALKDLEKMAGLKTLTSEDFSRIETLAQRVRNQLD